MVRRNHQLPHACPATAGRQAQSQRAQISPTGGWRCAKCRVELGVYTDDYGQQRTETDNTDDRPAGVQNKPYLHKPRKRHYPSRLPGNSPATGAQPPSGGTLHTTSRLSGNSRTTGTHPNRRQAESSTTSRLSGNSRTTGAKASGQGAISRRYSRVLQARSEGSGLMSSTQAASAARLARASEIAPPVTSMT